MENSAEEQVIVNEEEANAESAEATEQLEELDEQEEAEEQVEEQEEGEQEERPVSRRESLRIQALLQKLKQGDTASPEKRTPGLNYKDALNADETVLEELEADRRKYGDDRYSEGLAQAKMIEFRTNLKIDAPAMENKFPILQKGSKEFNPVVADALNSMYLKDVGFDQKTGRVKTSDLSYADFIESHMELAEEIANVRAARTVKNVAKQAANTGLRPSGGTAKRLNLNQAPQDMTNEELSAVIAQSLK